MKTAFFTLLLTCALVGSASAQKQQSLLAELPGTNEIPAERVEALTRAMATTLHLNEGQYMRLREVNRIKLTRLDEIQWQTRDNVAQQQAETLELQAQYETECSRILSPSQLMALREEQKKDQQPKRDPSMGGVG
ncbi:hypothetical protein F1C16_06845 [Hymenobacter sp. NBH84]|uniref:hypothetical protein n=1 Tax=Hymenobacter sp. NBH84 TaxID=2596915 RepID=UPI00162721AD|nr:hypothetical protein [Hymenobacter sp. NBH84]QNE39295.1 hypothetical protein F1C16_06845 [Hymenobacter sp. NBH84]